MVKEATKCRQYEPEEDMAMLGFLLRDHNEALDSLWIILLSFFTKITLKFIIWNRFEFCQKKAYSDEENWMTVVVFYDEILSNYLRRTQIFLYWDLISHYCLMTHWNEKVQHSDVVMISNYV